MQQQETKIDFTFIVKDNNFPRNLNGRLINVLFDNEIRLTMRMETPFKAKYFVIGSF